MRYAVVTLHDQKISELAAITLPNKQEYCRRHSYKLFAKTDNFNSAIPAQFEKPRFILEVLNSNPDLDWIWWLDTDALITNFSKTIEEFCDNNFDIVIGTEVYNWQLSDFSGINNGSFFIKNTDMAKKIIQAIIDNETNFYDSICFDQTCMIDLYLKSDIFKKYTKLVLPRAFNSQPYLYWDEKGYKNIDIPGRLECCQWYFGDFVLHLAGLPPEDKIKLAFEFSTQIKI